MQPLETLELKAFILALYQLNEPLPDAVQQQIKAINIPGEINKLYAIAQSYPPLAKYYNQVQGKLDAIAPVRSKGIDNIPDSLPSPLETEIDNASRKIDEALVKFEQKPDKNKRVEFFQQIFKALQPDKTARNIIDTILSS